MFRCKVCGWLHAGTTPPDICPSCGSPADRFRPVATGVHGDGPAASPDAIDTTAGARRLRLLAVVTASIDSPFARHHGPRLDVVTGDAAWFDDNIPCMRACPVSTDVASYIGHIAAGRADLAADINRDQNVFSGTLARTCSRPCEDACRRTVIDAPIQIRALKRIAMDRAAEPTEPLPTPAATGRTVAVVGAGVAGLATARDLARRGHAVTILDRRAQPGGLMTHGVPAWRLPAEIAGADLRAADEPGISFRSGVTLGEDVTVATLAATHDAVIIAAGAQRADRPDFPLPATLDASGTSPIIEGTVFLERVRHGAPPALDGPVVVIGGGYTAFDCARTARRLSAASVTIVMRHEPAAAIARAELPDALGEGIGVLRQTSVTAIQRDDADRLIVTLVDGRQTTHDVTAGLVVLALGHRPDWSILGGDPKSIPAFDPASGQMASPANVWLTGDLALGTTSFIDAIASGRRTARDVCAAIGEGIATKPPDDDRLADAALRAALQRRVDGDDPYRELAPEITTARPVPERALASGHTTVEVELGLADGRIEASRCLQCQANISIDADRCILCNGCVDACPYGCIEMVGIDRLASLDGRSLDATSAPTISGRSAAPAALVLDENNCIRCGRCVDWCPTSCLTMDIHHPVSAGQPQAFDLRDLLREVPGT